MAVKKFSNRYMATCAPGLEFVVADEIREATGLKIGNDGFCNITILTQTRGKVAFDCAPPGIDPQKLRCIDNLYIHYCSFPIGGHKDDLSIIGKKIADIDFTRGIAHINSANGIAPPYRVAVSASRRGKQTYSRHDIARRALESLIETGGYIDGGGCGGGDGGGLRDSEDGAAGGGRSEKETAPINYDIAIRIDALGDTCSIYSQMTTPQARFRGAAFQTAPGGIRPPVAHCLVRLSNPRGNDVFYDPFCGAGTIAYERAWYKSKRIFASDIDAGALEKARANLGFAADVFHNNTADAFHDSAAIVFPADAVKTMMKNNSVDAVVTNMPWGKQVPVGDIEDLYKDFFIELRRILKPRGRAVLLSDRLDLVEDSCRQATLKCDRAATLSLHGLHPAIFIVYF